MLDKQKLVSYLQDEIESCEIVRNTSDKAIIWECKRILRGIELGLFDSEFICAMCGKSKTKKECLCTDDAFVDEQY